MATVSSELDEEWTRYRLGVVDVYLFDWAEGTRLYVSAGVTTSAAEAAEADAAIVDGHFRKLVHDGTIIAYHPHAGYRAAYGPDEHFDEPAVLLREVPRIHD